MKRNYNLKLSLDTTFEDAINVALNVKKPKKGTVKLTTDKIEKKKWKWSKPKAERKRNNKPKE